MMTAKEMIKKYNMSLGTRKDGSDGIICRNVREIKKNKADAEITARREEIIAELKAQKSAEESARAERQAKIDAIPGLKKIQDARHDVAKWDDEFNRQMETESFYMERTRPQYDFCAMYAEFPQAAAYLKAEALSHKNNYELAAIGRQALEMVIDGDWQEALDYIKTENDKFVERHMWD